MKKFKLVLLLLMGIIMMFAVVGCGKKENKGKFGEYDTIYEYIEAQEKADENATIATIVVSTLLCIACGVVCSEMMGKCGLSKGKGFALGFLCSIVGALWCIRDCMGAIDCKLRLKEDKKSPDNNLSSGWKCTCGKTNFSYVGTCSCGKNKYQ